MLTVSVGDLRKTFHDEGRGQVRAVDGISFDAQGGEILGLLGSTEWKNHHTSDAFDDHITDVWTGIDHGS